MSEPLDLEAVLTAVTAHLVAGKAAEESGIPNVTTVSKGDYATPDPAKVHLTADWAGSSFSGGLPGSMLQEDTDIAVRGYLSNIPDDDVVNEAARALKTTIVNWMRKFKGRILVPRSARYIFPAEKPGFRFTLGVEVRYSVRQFG